MNEEQKKSTGKIPAIALIAIILGPLSLLVLFSGMIAGLVLNAIGMTSFITPAIFLGAGAVICGVIAQNEISPDDKPSLKMTRIGIIIGAVAILLAILIRVVIFIFFIPWLFAGF